MKISIHIYTIQYNTKEKKSTYRIRKKYVQRYKDGARKDGPKVKSRSGRARKTSNVLWTSLNVLCTLPAILETLHVLLNIFSPSTSEVAYSQPVWPAFFKACVPHSTIKDDNTTSEDDLHKKFKFWAFVYHREWKICYRGCSIYCRAVIEVIGQVTRYIVKK